MAAYHFKLPDDDGVVERCCTDDGDRDSEVEAVRAQSVSKKAWMDKYHWHHVDGQDVAQTIKITARNSVFTSVILLTHRLKNFLGPYRTVLGVFTYLQGCILQLYQGLSHLLASSM